MRKSCPAQWLAVVALIAFGTTVRGEVPPVAFGAPLDYPCDGRCLVAAGDFNGDHRADLAIAQFGSNYPPAVAILISDGRGGFLPPVTYPIGYDATAILAADFNGDGKVDLAVGDGEFDISVLLSNGDGTFQPAVTYVLSTVPRALAVGDFNGDGIPDLVASGGDVTILLGNGDGTFTLKAIYNPGGASVAVGDFNGDGRDDLALTSPMAGSVSILLGNGDATFQPAVAYPSGEYPFHVVAADFNRDGKPDLAVANTGGNSISILLGNGDGTFQAAVRHAVGHSPRALVVTDLNGDGQPDLAVANKKSSNVSVLFGRSHRMNKRIFEFSFVADSMDGISGEWGNGKLQPLRGARVKARQQSVGEPPLWCGTTKGLGSGGDLE
jgi:hypothetical protein